MLSERSGVIHSFRLNSDAKKKLKKLMEKSPSNSKKNLEMIKEEVKSISEKLKLLSLGSNKEIILEDDFQNGSINIRFCNKPDLRSNRRPKCGVSPKKAKSKSKTHKRTRSTIWSFNSNRSPISSKAVHRRSASKGPNLKKISHEISEKLVLGSVKKLLASEYFNSTCNLNFF